MDDQRFDLIARRLGALVDRRTGLKGVLAGVVALTGDSLGGDPPEVLAADTAAPSLDPEKKRRCRPLGKSCGKRKPHGRKRRCCAGYVCKKTGKKKKNGKKKRKCVVAPTVKCTVCADTTACAYQEIQPAIDAARSGGTVAVGDGTYNESLTINKDLVLRACNGATPTIVNAALGERTITVGEKHRVEIIDIVIDALTDKEADPTDDGYGGGIVSEGPLTLSGSTIVQNGYWYRGGGVAFLEVYQEDTYADPIVHKLTITDEVRIQFNESDDDGGGLFVDSYQELEMSGDVVVQNNRAGWNGGGIYLYEDVVAELHDNVLVDGNIAGGDGSGSGGGIYHDGYGGRVLADDNVTISNNWAGNEGGGIYLSNRTEGILSGNATVTKNRGISGGGGVSTTSRLVLNDRAAITQNRAGDVSGQDGDGGGVYNSYTTVILNDNSTIASNSANNRGGGVFLELWEGWDDYDAAVLKLNNAATVTGNGAQGGAGSGGGVFSNDTRNEVTGGAAVSGNVPDQCAGVTC